MNSAALSLALAACLSAGSAELVVLNVVVLPATRAPALVLRTIPPTRTEAEPPGALTPAASASEPASVDPTPLAVLEFAISSSRIDEQAAGTLRQALAQLSAARPIVVVGHADASGPEELNDRLSAQRAAAVAQRLFARGVPKRHVQIEARGEREPRANGNSRRVEIFVGGLP